MRLFYYKKISHCIKLEKRNLKNSIILIPQLWNDSCNINMLLYVYFFFFFSLFLSLFLMFVYIYIHTHKLTSKKIKMASYYSVTCFSNLQHTMNIFSYHYIICNFFFTNTKEEKFYAALVSLNLRLH